jgi:hypothetical protein
MDAPFFGYCCPGVYGGLLVHVRRPSSLKVRADDDVQASFISPPRLYFVNLLFAAFRGQRPRLDVNTSIMSGLAQTMTWRLTTRLVQALFASHLFVYYGYSLTRCEGPSMLPTLNVFGDFMLVEKWTQFSSRGYRQGDIVQGRHPYKGHPISKRIIGMVCKLRRGLIAGRGSYSCGGHGRKVDPCSEGTRLD